MENNNRNLKTKYYLKTMQNIMKKEIFLTSTGICYHIDGHNFIIDSRYEKQFNKLIDLYQRSKKISLKTKILTLLASISIITILLNTENVINLFSQDKYIGNIDKTFKDKTIETTEILFKLMENKKEQIKNKRKEYDIFILGCANDLNMEKRDAQKILTLTHEITNQYKNDFESFYNKIFELDSAQALNQLFSFLQTLNSQKNNSISKQNIEEITKLKEITIKMEKRKNRNYYDIPVYDQDFQDFIYDTSIAYNVPYKIGFILAELESGSSWKSNSLISNGNYGLTQINWCNLPFIKENYGYEKEEVLNNPYINMECCIRLLHDIYLPACNYNENNICYEDIFGTYNRWIIWKDYPEACEYVEKAMHLLNTKYSVDFIKENKENNQTLQRIQK